MTESKGSETTLSEKIHAKWEKLSEGDIRTIGKDMSILANKVSTVYKRSKSDVEKEIAAFQKSLPKQ